MAGESAIAGPAFPQDKLRDLWSLLGAILLAFLLPLPLLSQSLWIDEATSVWFARLPLGNLLFHLCDPHPPGYYLLLKGWLALGDSEAWLRLPSVLASALAVALTARAGRSIFGLRAGVLAALLLATFPLQSWYAAEARMYPLAQALGAALLLPAWRLWTAAATDERAAKHNLGWAAGFWLLAVLALAVDVSALLPFAALQLWWLAWGRPRAGHWLRLQAAILIPVMIWWLFEGVGADTYHAVFVAVQARKLGLSLDPGSAGALVRGLAAVAGLGTLAAAWRLGVGQGRARRPVNTWLLLAAWLVLLAFSAVPRLFTVKRLLVVILPYLALLLAAGLARWRPVVTRLTVLLGLAVTLWMLASFQREPWRETVAALVAVDTAPGPAVAWVDELAVPVFDYYIRRVAPEQAELPWTPLLGRELPALPALAPPPGGVLWLALAENPYRDLSALLPAEFHRQYRLEAEQHAPGIGLMRYRRLNEPLPAAPALAPPSPEALWGLQLPSPLAACR